LVNLDPHVFPISAGRDADGAVQGLEKWRPLSFLGFGWADSFRGLPFWLFKVGFLDVEKAR
jgi:hypothetical protein